jgi:WD40 repeat protein
MRRLARLHLGWLLGWLVAGLLSLALAIPATAVADTLFGAIGWETSREFGGFSEQPPGALVTVDVASLGPPATPSPFSTAPGGTTLVGDAYNTPDDGYLLGLDFAPDGSLFASTCDTGYCPEGESRLLEIDPTTGTSTEIGLIHDTTDNLNIYDLAFQPGTGLLYGISDFLGSSCFACLYTIDTATAEATLVGDPGIYAAGGLAFAPDGTLYLTTVYPTVGSYLDLYVLDPSTGAVVSREDVVLEQQFYQSGGGQNFLITSSPFQGLAVAPDGTLVSSGENGITVLYERVFDTVKDPTGTPISGPQWVWRVLGDSGENVTDLAFQPVPEPGTFALLAVGLLGLARRRRRR